MQARKAHDNQPGQARNAQIKKRGAKALNNRKNRDNRVSTLYPWLPPPIPLPPRSAALAVGLNRHPTRASCQGSSVRWKLQRWRSSVSAVYLLGDNYPYLKAELIPVARAVEESCWP